MSQADPTPGGVIHNIGYRGYEGTRLGRAKIVYALFAHSLRGVFGLGRSGKSKVVPMGMFVIMLLPALVLAVVTVAGPFDELLLPYTRYAMVLQAAIAIFIAVAAPQAVSLDLRFQALPLYFSRPLQRVDYVRAKFAALASGLFILIGAPLAILYLGTLAAGFDIVEQTGDFAVGLVGAAMYAVVLAGIGLLIASLTPRRGFGVAAIITVLALSYTIVTSLQGVVGYAAGNLAAARWIGLFSPMTLVDGVQVWLLGADSSAPAGPPDGIAGLAFVAAAVALVGLAGWALSYRYRKVTL
jgi:ABC-2 type transport system permease protein